MLDTLKWMFESGWHFVGVLVLLIACLEGIADIVKAARK